MSNVMKRIAVAAGLIGILVPLFYWQPILLVFSAIVLAGVIALAAIAIIIGCIQYVITGEADILETIFDRESEGE